MRLRSPPTHDRLSHRKSRLAVHDLRLELIEQDLVADGAIVNRVAAVIDILRERGEGYQRQQERQDHEPVQPCWPASLLASWPVIPAPALPGTCLLPCEKAGGSGKPSGRAHPP